MAILRTCPNMTLAVERDVKTPTLLVQNKHPHANIANYMAAIRVSFIMYAIPTIPFRDERLQLFLKFIKINSKFAPTIHFSITVDTLQKKTLQVCTVLSSPDIFSAFILICLFLCPKTVKHLLQ